VQPSCVQFLYSHLRSKLLKLQFFVKLARSYSY